MTEIELKLRGTPARLKAAFSRLASKAVKGSAFKKNLRAVYFDTAKDDLHAKGFSFRVRDEAGRFVQTLKRESVDAEILARDEWSDDIASATPELLHTKSGRKLREIWRDVRLLPRFQTEVTRSGFLLRPRRGALVEVVLDLGDIRGVARDDQVAVAEIEIELKAGSTGAIYDAALSFLEVGPFAVETRSKSGRGYHLLTESETPVVKATAFTAQKRDTLAEMLRATARRHFGQFLANMSGAIAHDPGSIHQMRVAMRRLRSALYAVRERLPEPEYQAVRLKLKYLLQSLGDARDWEVLTERLSEDDGDDADAAVAKEQVRSAAQVQKNRALERAVDSIGSRKSNRILLDVMRWFEDLPGARHASKLRPTAATTAAQILNALFGRVRRRGRHFNKLSVEDRHRLRIAGKNLRYNLELFGPLYPKAKVERFLKLLKPVQDDLGHLNDVSRARDLLGTLAKHSPQKAVAAKLVARMEAKVEAADKRAHKHVTALRNAKPFW